MFDAICPDQGKAAGLVVPSANTHARAEHLKVISANISPDFLGVFGQRALDGAHLMLLVMAVDSDA